LGGEGSGVLDGDGAGVFIGVAGVGVDVEVGEVAVLGDGGELGLFEFDFAEESEHLLVAGHGELGLLSAQADAAAGAFGFGFRL
jgi:hypothetical protein